MDQVHLLYTGYNIRPAILLRHVKLAFMASLLTHLPETVGIVDTREGCFKYARGPWWQLFGLLKVRPSGAGGALVEGEGGCW